jgi:hypothetical protein
MIEHDRTCSIMGSGAIEEPWAVVLVLESRTHCQICEFTIGVPDGHCGTLFLDEDGDSRATWVCVAEEEKVQKRKGQKQINVVLDEK